MASKCVVCAIPRRQSIDWLKKRVPGYSLLAASSLTALRRLARTAPCDLYVLQSPLGWDDAAAVCRSIRIYDAHTPIIVYALEPSPAERREVMSAGAQAYVARSDDPHNLHGRAGQLVMLAELRSMEAMTSNAKALQERVARGLTRIAGAAGGEGAKTRLKLQAARLFTQAGGTRANFERLWPALYERALERAREGGAIVRKR